MRFQKLVTTAALLLIGAGVSGCARGGYGFGPIPQGPSGGVPAPVGGGAPTPRPACRSALKTVPDPQAPHGLYVWIDSLEQTKNQPAILQYLPKDANLCGASIVVFWSAVDRGPAASPQYDFAAVESAIKPWASAGKLVNLLFANVNETGTSDTATPAWVLAQTGANKVNSVACPDPGPGQSAGPPTPVYWETGFEKPYRAFVKAVIAAYGGDPRIGYMRFGVGPGAEDFVAHGADGACLAKWQAYGRRSGRRGLGGGRGRHRVWNRESRLGIVREELHALRGRFACSVLVRRVCRTRRKSAVTIPNDLVHARSLAAEHPAAARAASLRHHQSRANLRALSARLAHRRRFRVRKLCGAPWGVAEGADLRRRAARRFALSDARQLVTQRKPTCDMPESIICGERAAGRKRRQ